MPRRRPSGKSNSRSKPRPVDRKDSKIKRWNKASDIELDEEDQFHASRDKILLNGDGDVEDEDEDEDEVFALEGVSEEDSEEAEEDEDGFAHAEDEDDDEDPVVTKKAKSKTKLKKASSPSDTGSEDESWGRSKSAYYSSNAAQIDSEDEEANELEEQEARRLQVKARDAIHEDDFGLGEGLEPESDAEVEDSLEEQSRPTIDVSLNDKKAVLQHLERENPEALALARDWDDTARNLIEMQAKIAAISEKETDGTELGLLHIYYRQFSPPVYFNHAVSGFLINQFLLYITEALLTYATTLAYYLHLRSLEKYAGRPLLLRQHPVLNRLLTLKQSLVTLENLGVGTDSQDEDDEDDKYEDESGEPGSETPDLWSILMTKGLESDELTDLLMDADDEPRKASKKDKIEVKPPKKKRKTSDDKNRQPIFDLVEPEFEAASTYAKKKRSAPADTSSTDAFGEATFLQHVDATDKQARRKSLRFHVSRIESATARRQNARVNAVGGDDDIPYRERRKEKEQRMEKEQQRKAGTLGMGGDDLDDADPEITDASSRSKKRRRDVEVEDDDDSDTAAAHGYYELVKRQAADKKSKKKIEYQEARAAERLVFGEHDAASGPRSVTRAIMKNKGLTPHRSKSVRNPRVKKRQKYEQAKKRVSSQRAVYKGGIGDASKYTGEQSGISKVIKSVRLG
ncbi:Sas10 C-terminal domain-containing protein [Suillus subalutaceus]|uniref:Sas10 C-terminal domain-containing protein n=1 Tax=Suillus subalutaceus TaxID=48586 RepID=UPI001B886740|nr:Sas10 C-terminal domain-containing protein [Suillus subalutaceus]KAG1848749.1 Sas10 C-terminal domain-containing protein [Suillus subalutaceus]